MTQPVFRYVVDPTDGSVRMKTRAAIPAPEGLLVVEQQESINVDEGVYSAKLGKVIPKLETKIAQEREMARQRATQAQLERQAAVDHLMNLIGAVSDTATREALIQLTSLLKVN